MVDVGDKPITVRRATATATVSMSTETAQLVAAGNAPKGDVVSIARIAAIQAAKRTDELIPLAHPLPLDLIDVEVGIDVPSVLKNRTVHKNLLLIAGASVHVTRFHALVMIGGAVS